MTEKLYNLLDLTNLDLNASAEDINNLCKLAQQQNVAAVCVYKDKLELCRQLMPSAEIKLATVCNFPTGDDELINIIKEMEQALALGADELDIVIPYHFFVSKKDQQIVDYIAAFREHCPKTLKVIIESGVLYAEQIKFVANACIDHGVDFIKTSTGKVEIGATLTAADIILAVIVARDAAATTGIKLSGGVRTSEQANKYLKLITAKVGSDYINSKHVRFGCSKLPQ